MLWLRRCRMHPFSLQLYSSYLSRPSYRHCHPTGCEAAPLPGTGWMWDRREWPRLGHLPDERSEELTWWRANTTISCSGRDLKNEQTKIIRTKKKIKGTVVPPVACTPLLWEGVQGMMSGSLWRWVGMLLVYGHRQEISTKPLDGKAFLCIASGRALGTQQHRKVKSKVKVLSGWRGDFQAHILLKSHFNCFIFLEFVVVTKICGYSYGPGQSRIWASPTRLFSLC